jgi:dTMP kinase
MWIAIEGMDGSGKTTQAALLADRLRMENKVRVWQARVPGTGAVGYRVREILSDPSKDITPYTEELLIAAAHHEFSTEAVRRLARGEWVVSDRSWMSAPVYSTGGKLNPDLWTLLYGLAPLARVPDLTIVLDLEAADARARATRASRVGGIEVYDAKPVDFYERIRQGYRAMGAKDGVELLSVGGAPVAEVSEAIWRVLSFHVCP